MYIVRCKLYKMLLWDMLVMREWHCLSTRQLYTFMLIRILFKPIINKPVPKMLIKLRYLYKSIYMYTMYRQHQWEHDYLRWLMYTQMCKV